jgi:hypothetical protein
MNQGIPRDENNSKEVFVIASESENEESRTVHEQREFENKNNKQKKV